MNEIYDTLAEMILHFQSRLNGSMNDEVMAFKFLKELSDSSNFLSLIVDYEDKSVVHLNSSFERYFHLGSSSVEKLPLEDVSKILHPEYAYVMPIMISYFNDPKNHRHIYDNMYCVKTSSGWQWTYACTRIASFRKDGSPKFLFLLGCDFNYLMNNNDGRKLVNKYADFFDSNSLKFKLLTSREKEILKLIAKEYTTKEIADQLFISTSTVDTHRKHLLQKLKVKSSIGLVKVAILFDLEN